MRPMPDERIPLGQASASSMTEAAPTLRSRWPDTTLLAAWLASVLLLLLLTLGAYAGRKDIMAAWPPSARLYHALGAAPPP